MNYKIKFFLFICIIGTINASDFEVSSSSGQSQEENNEPVQALLVSAIIQSEGSILSKEKSERSLLVHRAEQEISQFQRDLRRKTSSLQSEYDDLTQDQRFLTSEKFVEKKVGSFIKKVMEDKQKDQEQFDDLSKKVSTLRGSFHVQLGDEKNILLEENSVDSLIGSLRVIAKEHGFKESPFLKVPSLRLNGSKLHLNFKQEGEQSSGLSIACNLGSGIRQADSTTEEQAIIATSSRRVKTKNNCFSLERNYVDETFLDENSDTDGHQSFDEVRKSSSDSLASLKDKSKNMNDDDSDYE